MSWKDDDDEIPRRIHVDHHLFVDGWINQWRRIIWAVITTIILGAVTTLGAVLVWAFTTFVERGGK